MASLPAAIQNLVDQLILLPGIGRRGAERIVTHLMSAPSEKASALAEAVGELRGRTHVCHQCDAWCDDALCSICADPGRDGECLCVVEQPSDLYAFEQAGVFNGRYHVLGGTLSPMSGVTPEDLNIASLLKRVKEEPIREVIIATSPNVQGDATAHYLAQQLGALEVEVARIGVGIPLGANLGYADPGTLKLALEGRRKMNE